MQSEFDLYQWFLTLTPANLPPTPFQLKPAVTIRDAELWLASMKSEVEAAQQALAGKRKAIARQRTGALQADLQVLKEQING